MSISKIVYLGLIIFISACSNAQINNEKQKELVTDSVRDIIVVINNEIDKNIKLDTITCDLNFKPGNNYKQEKSKVNILRNNLYKKYNTLSSSKFQNDFLDSAALVFTNVLLNNIIPYWYNTEWDFNGHTSVPNKGEIACGYFVSTTLRDMGLNVNRYKLAQQNPENEAKTIAVDVSELKYFINSDILEEVARLSNGIYFIGLDNHVGYLYKYNDKSYFIHSNYIENKVMIENIRSSEAFYSYNYYISKISGNRKLILKWLRNEEMLIVKE